MALCPGSARPSGWSLAQEPGLSHGAPLPGPLTGPGPFQSLSPTSEAWVVTSLAAGAPRALRGLLSTFPGGPGW